jgi:tRNA (cytidine56-2'-O)-methyltransferase
VLRLSHRKERDKRVTTHVGLVARAFGADGIILSGDYDENVLRTWRDVTERWGGPFDVQYTAEWRKTIKEWKERGGIVVHLTMYGIPVDKGAKQARDTGKDVLVVVGGEKVPREVYDLADFNVAVGNQPHSEIAALAIFLDRYFRGKEFEKKFEGAKLEIVPNPRGKTVLKKDFGAD